MRNDLSSVDNRAGAILYALRQINRFMTRENDPQRLIQSVCDILTKDLHYFHVLIALTDSFGKSMTAFSGEDKGLVALFEQLESNHYPECIKKALYNTDVLRVKNPISECPSCPIAQESVDRTCLFYRLEFAEKVFGVLAVVITPQFAEDEKEQEVLGEIAQDLSFLLSKMALEEQAFKDHRRLEFVIDGAGLGTWEWNTQTGETVFNGTWAKMLGYAAAELQPYNLETWKRLAHPDDLERVMKELASCLHGEREAYECEMRMKHKDGHWIWILDRGRIMTWDDTGAPLLMFGTHTNISRLKTTETDLREHEQYLRVILETAADGFWVIDKGQKIVEVNDAYCTMSGYAREEILEMQIGDLDAKEIPDETKGRIERILKNGKELFETLHRRKDGGVFPVEISVTFLNIHGGRFVCFCRDLTERKQREERIALLGQMLDEAPASITIHKTDGTFVYANRVTAALHGYQDEQEFLSIQLRDLDVPESESLIADRMRQIKENGFARFEVAHYRKDKTVFPLEVLAKAIYWHGEPAILSVAADITEQKLLREKLQQSEARFRSMVEASPLGMYLYRLDADRRLILESANPSADRIIGIDHAQLLGLTIEQAFPGLVETELPEKFRKVAEGVLPPQEFEIPYKYEQINGHYHVSVFQTIPGYIAVSFADISEKKKADAERERLRTELAHSQKMESVGRLAGGVAHDFNNMLGVILGHTEMALESLDPTLPIYANLLDVFNAAKRSADLTGQLLAFARKQTIEPVVMDLNKTVASMISMLKRLIGEDIDFSWLPNPNAWLIKADPSQIDQILANLCVNARDAVLGVGKITIETGNRIFDREYCAMNSEFLEGEYVLLAVSDNGHGMDKETIAKLFEPFFTTKELGKGTGLGLATVYGIVKQNKGFINVYSEVGKGTRFSIYLPRYAGSTKQRNTDTNAEAAAGKETVLLVEDEPPLLKMTSLMLERLGYKVLTADSPQKGVQVVESYKGTIDLLITDVIMPEMNGRELADKLTRHCPSMKCLFISGYTANVIAHHGVLEAGVYFIQKPFSVSDFAAIIRTVLDNGQKLNG